VIATTKRHPADTSRTLAAFIVERSNLTDEGTCAMNTTIEDTISNLANPARRRTRRDVRTLADYLSERPRLADCSLAELSALVAAGDAVSIPAHWAFLQQGAPATDMYLLLTGDAGVYQERRPVASVGAGDFVGELGLLRGGQRTATVTTNGRVKALRVDYGRLHELFVDSPALARTIAELGAKRLAAAA